MLDTHNTSPPLIRWAVCSKPGASGNRSYYRRYAIGGAPADRSSHLLVAIPATAYTALTFPENASHYETFYYETSPVLDARKNSPSPRCHNNSPLGHRLHCTIITPKNLPHRGCWCWNPWSVFTKNSIIIVSAAGSFGCCILNAYRKLLGVNIVFWVRERQ